MTEIKSEVANERAREKRYRDALSKRHDLPVAFEAARNLQWTGSSRPSVRPTTTAELIGRVRLRAPNEPILDGASEFYIGYGHEVVDGIPVFSWAAPVACTFFRGSAHHSLCSDVVLTRTFEHRSGEISDFEDQRAAGSDAATTFAQQSLIIARRPPQRRPVGGEAARPHSSAPLVPGPQRTQPTPTGTRPLGSSSTSSIPPAPAPPHEPAPAPSGPPLAAAPELRAPELLKRQLNANRTGSMQSVLATLQPDQYELITRAASNPLVVDGHPGSGKTIIAVHRAAYLAGSQEGVRTEDRVNGTVLLVGPTEGFKRHVSSQMTRLLPNDSRIRVFAIDELLALCAGLSAVPEGVGEPSRMHVAQELAGAVDQLLASAESTSVASVYNQLRSERLHVDDLVRSHLDRLPPFEVAVADKAHLPLLSHIGVRLRPPAALANVAHVVLDEAQDMTQLDWLTLKAINRGSWTLVGDMNQRRAPFTVGSWPGVLAALGVSRRLAGAQIVPLARGYRSTSRIIAFADRLLEDGKRPLTSLQQGGEEVAVTRVQKSALSEAAVTQAFDLLRTCSIVSVISVDPGPIRTELRQLGWHAEPGNVTRWRSGAYTIDVQTPNDARGLEFDGVVVVEPTAIMGGLDSAGRLYTALTRANRELRVVHAEQLPFALRTV